MKDAKNNLERARSKKAKVKYIEEQLKKVKDKKLRAVLGKILKELKKDDSLEKKVESGEAFNEWSEKIAVKRQLIDDIADIIKPEYEKKSALEESAKPAMRMEEPKGKKYESRGSYGANASDYSGGLNVSLYDAGKRRSFREVEDRFIKDEIITPGIEPTIDQREVMRERLRRMNPGASDESIFSYEREIIADLKKRKDIYSSKVR